MSKFQDNIYDLTAITNGLAKFEFWLDRLAATTAIALVGGKKIFLCGNGGSAADAAHIATEFTCRFKEDRRPYPAIALGVDGGLLTAIGNDYTFYDIFSRQVEAFGKQGDIFIGISTSGNSKNIIRALRIASRMDMFTALFLGGTGGISVGRADYEFIVQSNVTARIQEAHQFLLHEFVRLVEEKL